MVVTLQQVQYLESKMLEAIGMYPDNINLWLSYYRVIAETVITMDNMGVDSNEFGHEGRKEILSAQAWLVNNWPLNHSEPEIELLI